MRIQKITFTTNTSLINKKNEDKSKSSDLHQYKTTNKPFAYRDFNINFTARLFRTPENFYAQPFNQNGMPQTMKEYLYDDFEDRQKMPPAQMLKLVFNDINDANSLEQVKQIFPQEFLFANLSDTPKRNSRSGVLAEIELLKEEDKPLFKDGTNHLGMYILKKIYQEGKTLKEINTDFEKDLSTYYKGLSPIQYETLSAYGIKYPNNSFWKSLTATREEFPYEYKPRKAVTPRTPNSNQSHQTDKPAVQNKPIREKKKFDNVKDWEIDKLADALVKGNGSKTETEKQIKKKNIQNEETQNFVAKYMGEINSIVLEKLHISEDMKDYFENYDDLTKSQREKFESYMRNPYINDLRSKVMSSTIRLFFDLYGADGNNEDFQELLEYAHNIKPERIARQKEHDRIQELYEKELGIFDTQANETPTETTIDDMDDEDETLTKYQKLFDEIKKEYNVESYDFVTKNGEKVTILSNLQEALQEKLEAEMKFMPKQLVNNFIKYVKNNPAATEPYILTTLLQSKGIELPEDSRLMPEEQAFETTLVMYQDYTDNNQTESRAAQQAITDAFIEMTKEEITPALFRLGLFEFIDLYKSMQQEGRQFILNESGKINEKYNEYKRPLSDSEINKATITVMDLLRKYNPENTIIKEPTPFIGFDSVFYSIRLLIQNKDMAKERENLKDDIRKYIKEYGGSIRFLLDKKMPEALKMAKLEQFLCNYAYDKPGLILTYAALNKDGMNYLRDHNTKMYDFLKKEVLMKMPMLTQFENNKK